MEKAKEMKVTKETYEISGWGGLIFLIVVICFLVFLAYLLYSEYKLEKSIVEETYAHNGTCVRKGIYNECSYYGDKTTIINSESKCYINDIEVDCSNIKDKEHFYNNGKFEVNGVCPSPNSNMTIEDCINQEIKKQR